MYKRGAFLYGVIAVSIGVLITVLFSIYSDFSVTTSKLKSSRKKVLCVSRGFIYDRNLLPLVNEKIYNKSYFLNENNSVNGITVDRYNKNLLCSHLIGYVDSENKGVSGIEKCYDDILSYYSGELFIEYSLSATGNMIGEAGETENKNYLSFGGVVLTIDKNIQFVTEKCLDDGNLEKGAAVVMEVSTGKILALVSRPNFNPNEIEKYLNNENSPLINRALTEYSVGSVFKPIIAASALENGINPDEKYECKGRIKIGDTVFPCHKTDGHGETDLYSATANSCNTYYINLTKNIGFNTLLNTAENFGFGSRYEIADNLFTDNGKLPDENNLTIGEKANFSFGQGRLTATPVHLAAAYAAIGNKGIYNPPIIVDALVDENRTEYKKVKNNASRRVLSEKNSEIVLKALAMTVDDGSGKNAKSEIVSSVGKTATAQSGQFMNGKEITHSWFIGMFPRENPKYVVVILKENGESGSVDCAPIFKDISQLITSYE
ncbi:MAG: penicillin-binding protein 2 [Ruminococcaceae bacterium]|nr:penicillin-binding protein 2 [Oscillospiraceae bacterium]